MLIHISMKPEEFDALDLVDCDLPKKVVRPLKNAAPVEYLPEPNTNGSVAFECYLVDIFPAGPDSIKNLERWRNCHLDDLARNPDCKKILLRTDEISLDDDFDTKRMTARLYLRYSEVRA